MVDDILEKINIPPDDENLQYRKDWEEFEEKMGKTKSNAKKTVRSFRKIADRFDEAWWEYKTRYAAASLACVIGGVITLSTGNVAAMGFGLAGAFVSIKANSVKNAKDFENKKMAEELLKETKDNFIAAMETFNEWSVEKEYARMIYLYGFAKSSKVVSPQVLEIIREIILDSMGISMGKKAINFPEMVGWIFGQKAAVQDGAEGAAKVEAQAGAKTSTHEAGKNAAEVVDDGVQAGAKTSTHEAGKNAAQVADDAVQAGAKTSTQEAGKNAAQVADDAVQAGTKTSTQEAGKNAAQVADDAVQAGAKTSTHGAGKNAAQSADDAVQAGTKTSTQEAGKNAAQVADDVAEAGWKTAGISQNFFIVLNTGFLVLDTIDFGFTIIDLVQNKGSDAAKDLREIAKDIEDAFTK